MNENRDDATLVAALDAVRDPARRCFEHYTRQEEMGAWLEKPSPDIEELRRPVIVAMETHRKFANASSRFFGSKQLMLNSNYQAANLLRVAVERSAEAALAWWHKVHATQRADLRYVAEVHGLKVEEQLRLSNGVSLVPLGALPSSPNAAALQSQFRPRPGHWDMPLHSIPIGAIIEARDIDASPQYAESAGGQKAPPRSEELERTIRTFTLVDGASPVVGRSWLEFVDTDLAMAEFGRMQMSAIYEGKVSVSPVDVNPDAIGWFERYSRLTSEVRPQCDIALARLNLARRRLSPGDKAIDGAICLEALLLTDEENQEVNYRLRLRAALLLGNTLQERKEISKSVKEFYSLRSKTVHGSSDNPKVAQKNEQCAARGLSICARALREIVERNQKFDPHALELTGGNPSPVNPMK